MSTLKPLLNCAHSLKIPYLPPSMVLDTSSTASKTAQLAKKTLDSMNSAQTKRATFPCVIASLAGGSCATETLSAMEALAEFGSTNTALHIGTDGYSRSKEGTEKLKKETYSDHLTRTLEHLNQLGCGVTSIIAATLNGVKTVASSVGVKALGEAISPVSSQFSRAASATAILGWGRQIMHAKKFLDLAEQEELPAQDRLQELLTDSPEHLKELIGPTLFKKATEAEKTSDDQKAQTVLNAIAEVCYKKIVTTSISIAARSVNTGGNALAVPSGGLSLAGPVLGAGWAAFDHYTKASEKIAQELWTRRQEKKEKETDVSVREELSSTDPRFLIQEAFRTMGLDLEDKEDYILPPSIAPVFSFASV